MTGFVFPNEGVIEWDLIIAIYPYITGLVAGAFVVSSLYHVFGLKSLKPVSRFSLITALAFLIVTPLPLVIHLGRPERALEMFLTPNLTSAMSAFGYIWLFYLVVVVFEIWLIYRPDIVKFAGKTEGLKKAVYSVLALGVYDVSEESLAVDRKLIKALAIIGIPSAFLLHGYVGFIFGAVKANPWWSTPLMPIIFLLSAIVSGKALLIVMYVIVARVRKMPLDYGCLRSLGLWLGGFLSMAVVLEGLEVFTMLYEAEESWEIISTLITQRIGVSYFGIQFIMGAIIPFLLLWGIELTGMGERPKTVIRVLASVLILTGVFAMRWNVVIGGQLISKSLRGFTSYTPPLLGEGGILLALALLALPFLIFLVLYNLLPPWQHEIVRPERKGLGFDWHK